MWGDFVGKLTPVLDGLRTLGSEHPVEGALYFLPLILLLGFLALALWRGQGRTAYWLGVAVVVLNIVFSWGDDTYTHIYRIVALSEQFRHGEPGMLLTNPTTGQVLPVFVFYSVLPYIAPTLLDLVGVPAVVSFKLALAAQYLVMAIGLVVLIEASREAHSLRRRDGADYVVALLFLFANYVYTLWCTRAALAEIWVYSFIPWVVAGIVAPWRTRSLAGLIFLQACGHPIVLAQSLVCELIVPLALARLSLAELVRRSLPALLLALLFAAPFWLPQFLWKDFILGPAGLPDELLQSFRTLTDTFHVRDFRSIGPWMPLAILLLALAAGFRLSAGVWFAMVVWLGVLALQSVYLSALMMKVPVLNLSVFIWRFMLPASFLAFGVLLAGWRQADMASPRLLGALALLSVGAMMWVSAGQAPRYFVKLAGAQADRQAQIDYDRGDGIWGIKEFLPRLATLPTLCPGEERVQKIRYGQLRTGILAERPYLAIKDGPFGFVTYVADGQAVPLGACGQELVLGPVKAGQTLAVRESPVDWLFYGRMLDLLVVAAGVFALGRGVRRRERIQGWKA